MYLFPLALRSLLNRRFSALLTVLAIALSVTLLLGVEKIRNEARASFAGTISGTDLIVGPRTGSVQLLLYSVFRIGNATSNMRWDSYQRVAEHPRVDWAVPISLGDSHRGFKVMGTTGDYFKHFRHGRDRALLFTEGRAFDDLYDTVIGADIARELNYQLGSELVLAHGTGAVSFVEHADKPFRVSGILGKTGTPVDRTIHISLEGMEALHVDWQQGMPARGAASVDAEQARSLDLTPTTITAMLLGLDSRVATFAVQRDINRFPDEPLMAVLPGVALQELWSLLGVAEQALFIVSVFVVLTGLVGMLTAILASLNERRREMAILRSVGARPRHVFGLLLLEAAGLALAGILLGLGLMYLAMWLAQPVILSHYGLFIPITAPGLWDWSLLGAILLAAIIMGCVPAWRAYRQSLIDGLSIRT
ncbi:ABC transporter permease [Pseudomonas sp. G11-1]|uniref:ABC transporter permease n=1 Tax=Halopseudomonas bauzanensis TaxID=653930 RepID=A0A031M006_9GAMM|nr:ABC transporter permease [Halopseudomonas bauzanensis]MCO5787801.1 ABC transporter permease [Pseudomonas sp. G11-1]MCO5791033.1 ABC transporter permease [Pseudomonas sp. G11-2]EZQ13937.1 peptide ABC transporter permease [Halopseudomonas bauzanensis]TKA89857.1 ABC transporter permease [Halopseudomonas bauzanensis]SES35010.1 putative ABC transport system permease protein [Halopseudomonas bauzanensis]